MAPEGVWPLLPQVVYHGCLNSLPRGWPTPGCAMGMSTLLSLGAQRPYSCAHQRQMPLLSAALAQRLRQDMPWACGCCSGHILPIFSTFTHLRRFPTLLSCRRVIRGLATTENRSRDFQVKGGNLQNWKSTFNIIISFNICFFFNIEGFSP